MRKQLLSILTTIMMLMPAWLSATPSNGPLPDSPTSAIRAHLIMLAVARPPEQVGDYIVFSVRGRYRSVGVAFSHEDWASVHYFEINSQGTFVFALSVPFGDTRLSHYRLVLDGMWTVDPTNQQRAIDPDSGLPVSLLTLPDRSLRVYGLWHPAAENRSAARFYFSGAPGQFVSVAGSFNGWDPFLHILEEVSPGQYELALQLPPGTYYYAFFHDGQRLRDPLNGSQAIDPAGRLVSVLTIATP